uniref:Timeless N-terminal domain-containing protein n=1 Tax=Hyaloperonospora arabidopsidis (strain Emoy2) TaxID=559515 RepID=M4BWM0_HYAAE
MVTGGNEMVEDADMSLSDSDSASTLEPSLDDAMLNELLLVCSNLGMLRVSQEGEAPVLMRGEDCEQWIHDLQRAVRRDHATHRLVAKQLGQWQILQKKLLPLLVHHQHDWPLVFSILKVLVMLTTKPPRDSSHIAQQLQYLRQYKHEFLRLQVVPILMTILVHPLSRKGAARTSSDFLNMEIVLMLLRNLLAIPDEDPRYVTSTTAHFSHLQEELIRTLYDESVYEMLLLFAQDIDSAENREWNLLIMEMLDLTLDCSQPHFVAAYAKKQLTGGSVGGSANGTHAKQVAKTTVSGGGSCAAPRLGGGDLLDKLNNEKKASGTHQLSLRRHSNFGGVLTVVGPTGRSTVVSDFSKPTYDQVPQVAKKPTSRRRGKKSAAIAADIHEVFGGKGKVTDSDERTMQVLQDICDSIIAKSYFQLTNSLKTEFRRGSSKLIATDRLQYFHLVWFLTTYHRLKIQTLKSHYKRQLKAVQEPAVAGLRNASDLTTPLSSAPEKPDYGEKAVLSTLDMFSFNFVLQSIENYATMKNYHGMTVAVQLLTGMMAYLAELAASDDLRFQRIADSLQHKIFYERDFLDRLPVLLKTWSPGLFPKAKRQKKKPSGVDGEGSDGSVTDEEETEQQAQVLMEMQRKEADFDVRRYFASMVSADTVRMYCSLLADYRENSAKVNHYIHSFLYRTKLFKVHQQEEWTMQPMLFNIHVLLLFNKMLQDTYIQRLPEYKNLLDFIRGVVRNFFTLADKNNLLFVEVLLRQTYPSKSCVLIQRSYDPIDSMSKLKSQAIALGRENRIEATNESRRHRTALDHEELEGEAEFQFTLGPSDFDSASLLDMKDIADDEIETECASMDLSLSASASAAKSKPERTTSVSRAATERAENWSKVEDRYLAKVFMKFRHLPSVYDVISCEDMFQERDRTSEQIKRRVKYLKLHRENGDLSDEHEQSNSDGEQDGGQARQKKALDIAYPRRRLRRGADLSDDESDDDLLLQGRVEAPLDPLQAASATHGSYVTSSVTGSSGAVPDDEMNDASLHAESSSETTPTLNDDAHKGQCKEDTRMIADSIHSRHEYQIRQPADRQTTDELDDSNADGSIDVVAEVSTAHEGAKVESTDGPATVTAGMDAANIDGSQDDVIPVDADAQPNKRARTTGDDVCMEGTPAKKICAAKNTLIHDADASQAENNV